MEVVSRLSPVLSKPELEGIADLRISLWEAGI